MAIKVCDAIMGSGKSSAAIMYMNEHPDKKFIYITPYLEEAERIRNSCPDLRFKEPNNRLPEFGFRKFKHSLELIRNGENITSTHNMFLRYSDEMVELIREHKYTLIIDEAVDIFRQSKIKPSTMRLYEDAGWVDREDGEIKITPKYEVNDGFHKEIASLSKGNRIINIDEDNSKQPYYFWIFSVDILDAFEDIYVLTYLFEAQDLKYFLDLNKLEFQNIGINKTNGVYRFSDTIDYIPDYVATLSSKIHILDNKKLNAVGDKDFSLSATWFDKEKNRHGAEIDRVRKNLYNYFIHYNKGIPSSKRMWSSFKSVVSFLRDKGFYRSDIPFNMQASNAYSDKTVLAYCVNIFLHPADKICLSKCGVDIKEDRYALSVMLQWIWRSAIRHGEDIYVYIPSKRMRELLINWIAEVEQFYITHSKKRGGNEYAA